MYLLTSETISWKGLQGSAEASDLRLPVGTWPSLIDVKSHKTGEVKSFYIHTARRNEDNEVLWVDYRTFDRNKLINLRVYND